MKKGISLFLLMWLGSFVGSLYANAAEDTADKTYIRADPYMWPYDGNVRPENTALIIIDMQGDFCLEGGYVSKMGYDITLTRKPIEPIKKLLAMARRIPGLTIIHTREGHRPDLSDCPANKMWRSIEMGAEIGSMGPLGKILIRGERGWQIIEELAPREGEIIIDKPGKGSFYATDLEIILKHKNIRNLIIAGITTDVCVHTTMRDANDQGYECIILSDCTGATDLKHHEAALEMVKMQGGIFGAVTDSQCVEEDFLSKFFPKEKSN